MCMYGGLRFKQTDLVTNCKAFEDAIRVCDNSHQHLPYTVKNDPFDTSLEARYPKEFCKALVHVAQSHFNAQFQWQLGVHQQPKRSLQAALATGYKQLPPQLECSLGTKRCIVKCLQCGPAIEYQGARLLRRTLINGGSSMMTDNNNINVRDSSVEAAMNPSLGKELQNDSSVDNASSAECSNCGNKVMVEADHSSKESVELAFGVFRNP